MAQSHLVIRFLDVFCDFVAHLFLKQPNYFKNKKTLVNLFRVSGDYPIENAILLQRIWQKCNERFEYDSTGFHFGNFRLCGLANRSESLRLVQTKNGYQGYWKNGQHQFYQLH